MQSSSEDEAKAQLIVERCYSKECYSLAIRINKNSQFPNSKTSQLLYSEKF